MTGTPSPERGDLENCKKVAKEGDRGKQNILTCLGGEAEGFFMFSFCYQMLRDKEWKRELFLWFGRDNSKQIVFKCFADTSASCFFVRVRLIC